MSAELPGHEGLDLRQRQKTTAAVFTRATGMDELSDGYRLSFPGTETWRRTLEAFAEAWRESCPQMSFEIRGSNDGERWWLEIRGPLGTREWVRSARHMLTSTLNPAPSLAGKARLAWRVLTSPLRVLPDFLILGEMKSGTTALYSYLLAHSSIFSAFRKELYYFDSSYSRGATWYRSFFPTLLQKTLCEKVHRRPFVTGEASPSYLYHSYVAERVAQLMPRGRFLVLLRNPIDRAYSFYNHNRRAGLENLSFEEALDREGERMALDATGVSAAEGFSFGRNNFSYVARGLYVDQLSRWREHVPAERMLVLTTEDLSSNPEDVLGQALDFLGLPYEAPAEFMRMNGAPYPAMKNTTRERLAEQVRPHNERLYQFLGRDLGW